MILRLSNVRSRPMCSTALWYGELLKFFAATQIFHEISGLGLIRPHRLECVRGVFSTILGERIP